MHSGEKSNKCNQCNFASTWPADLRIHFKSHSGERSIDAASVIMHPLEQATLGTTWKCTIEFSSVHSKSLRLLLIIHSAVEKSQINATKAILSAVIRVLWGRDFGIFNIFWFIKSINAQQNMYSIRKKFPANTNTIRFEKITRIRIRIIFGLKKLPEYEYE
jgi:hypothetical protein